MHLAVVMKAFFVLRDQLKSECEHIPLFHFAQILDMSFQDEEAVIRPLDIGLAAVEAIERAIEGLVEHDIVIADVHVAVVIHPFGQDGGVTAVKGSWREHGGNIE